MYSQFFEIGEAFEYVCWKLSDVVHAQVTVETGKKIVWVHRYICKDHFSFIF